MLTISQKLSQQQKLSPQQIQYQKLLQLNTLALEQRIKTELELNPILEEELDIKEESLDEKDNEEAEGEEEYEAEVDDEFDVEDMMSEEELDSDYMSRSNQSEDDARLQPVAPAKESLSEHLLNQLTLLDINEDLELLGEEIIGNLDDDGYLKQDIESIVKDLEVLQGISISMEEAESLLKRIQRFDPIGIASRNLQECLLVQIHYSTYDPYYSYLAEQLLTDHFKDFVQKRYDALQQKMELSRDTLKAVLEVIQKLNPKPGEGNIEDMALNQVTPDFLIEKVDDNFIITLNDRSLPSVTINKTYLEMLEQNRGKRKKNPQEKNTYKFLREKFESARWFIACIEQRRETLMKVMRAILERQYEFFEKGTKHLRPMIYKDIAEEINMDISTISRVVNGKFVQSPMGIHELKYFFSEGLSTDSGEEVSNKHIKIRIGEIIENESKSKPLSDDKIADMLKKEGIHIARRTVAKYREQMRIPVARLRKQFQ